MKKSFEFKKYNCKAVFSLIKPYCYFADEHDYIEIIEWNNGEGVTIDISSKSNGIANIKMTNGEWTLVKKLMKQLYKSD